ncbi:MAG: 2OG-Fe dioxygenase family protein [Pseudomonadota bacterium]|nr:2OG-Fe dioxygenase family protein [Pseudomonadota bacterium]
MSALRTQGFAVLDARSVCALAGVQAAGLARLAADWADLPPDEHLKDGGKYRRRRHASLVTAADGTPQPVPHRAHWQPLQYNALHGGMQRWFAPATATTAARSEWLALPHWLAGVASALRGVQPWFIESHMFRIDTAGGIGRPTPEGAHRDGVDLVAVFLVARHQLRGGETRVFALDEPHGLRFTLTEPWSVLLMDDSRVMHETTPIQPKHQGQHGHRDTLVITLRAGGFLAPSH